MTMDLEWLRQLDLDTPSLLLDRAALEHNVTAMAAFARRHGVALRPHAKTHKSADIARLQLAAGALGVCVAKLGEAEALAAAGIDRLTVTAPLIGRRKLARLQRLAGRVASLMVVVDDLDAAAALAAAVAGRSTPLDCLVDLDVGLGRTGLSEPTAVCRLARFVEEHPALRYAGVQAYAGQIQHLTGSDERRAASLAVGDRLRALVEALAAAGLPPEIVTGSGTGTFAVDARQGVFTELQVGSYVFVDDEYAACAPLMDEGPELQRSAFVLAQVISRPAADVATIDAGSKSLSYDGPLPSVQAPGGLQFQRAGDEFAKVVGGAAPALGERVLLGLPHCDPTVNLFDAYTVVADGAVVAEWPVTARGRAD
ncbi:MAG: DSD1 family PLP-dependent enzyme [Geminicoccaceae bacterium]|nr:MAG: DSD1 family PLP-dependent enzyme [Geminicoccaceae bacterium]